MTTNAFDNLCGQASEWKHQASDLDFLGEIALPQTQLEILLRSLGVFHQRVDEPELSFALAVAAVNWAYWRGVDEDQDSRGFRESFMTHSLGYFDPVEWNRSWGPAIEQAICDWSHEPPRLGRSYRYVGLVLRHAGVPHTKIPRLAQLLQEIDRHIGWPNVLSARDAEIQGFVTSFFGNGCVGEHLASEAGMAYLRSLCADLMLLRSRPSQSGCDLPGYRPGLLPALLANLDLGSRPPAAPPIQLPYVIFDPASGRIELVFDERLVRRRESIHCDQWERRLFDARLDLGPGGVEPASTYSGRLPDGRPWSAKGWRYTDTTAWALFRTDGRLVTTHAHEDPVATGDYLLALTPTLDAALLWPDADDDGERYLPDGTECHLWHVPLREGDDGKLPKLRVTTSVHPWLECANPGGLSRWTGFEAVCADAPRITIGGWTARNSRRFRLTMNTPDGLQDLHPPPSASGVANITLSELPAGVVAEVSLVPVGFQHGPRATQTMRVVRFQGSIDVENGLWPLEQPATLRVVLSDGIQLEAEETAKVIAEGQRDRVVVPPHEHWALLRAVAVGASLPLRVPVRRCSFSTSDAPASSALFDRVLLRQMCDTSSPCRSFTVSAIPGGTVDLLVRDRRGANRVWRRGLRLGSNGRLELPATELVDVTRNESGILELVVQCGGFEVATGALFVDPSATDLDTGPWPQPVEQYLQLLREPLTTSEGLNLLAEVTCLHRHALLIALADRALGLSPISPNPRLMSAAPEWIAELDRLLATSPSIPGPEASVWKAALLAWVNAAPVPFRPTRWEAAIRSLIAEVDRRVDVSGPLSHLLAGVTDPSVPDGLVHGWRCYVEAGGGASNADRLLLQANGYFATAARGEPPWSAIAERLSAWTLLRAGALVDFSKAVARLTPNEHCRGLTGTLRAVASLLAMKPTGNVLQEPGGLERSSRQDDRLLASAVAGDSDARARAADICWLSAWLAWRWSVIMELDVENRDVCRLIAKTHVNEVPARACETLTEELRSGVPRPIIVKTEFE